MANKDEKGILTLPVKGRVGNRLGSCWGTPKEFFKRLIEALYIQIDSREFGKAYPGHAPPEDLSSIWFQTDKDGRPICAKSYYNGKWVPLFPCFPAQMKFPFCGDPDDIQEPWCVADGRGGTDDTRDQWVMADGSDVPGAGTNIDDDVALGYLQYCGYS